MHNWLGNEGIFIIKVNLNIISENLLPVSYHNNIIVTFNVVSIMIKNNFICHQSRLFTGEYYLCMPDSLKFMSFRKIFNCITVNKNICRIRLRLLNSRLFLRLLLILCCFRRLFFFFSFKHIFFFIF